MIPFKELKNCKYHCKNVKGYIFLFIGIFMLFPCGMLLYRTWADKNDISAVIEIFWLLVGISLFIMLLMSIVLIFASRKYMRKLLFVCKLSPQAAEIIRFELEVRYGARLHWSVMINPSLLFFIGKILEHSPKTGKSLITNAEIAKNMMDIAVKYDERLRAFYDDSPQNVAIKLEASNERNTTVFRIGNVIKKIFGWSIIIVTLLFALITVIKIIMKITMS